MKIYGFRKRNKDLGLVTYANITYKELPRFDLAPTLIISPEANCLSAILFPGVLLRTRMLPFGDNPAHYQLFPVEAGLFIILSSTQAPCPHLDTLLSRHVPSF